MVIDGDWLERHLGDDGVVVLEVDEHPSGYEHAHVPGAHRIDPLVDLVDHGSGDLVGPHDLGSLLGSIGVRTGSTIVVYGDNANWWAAHACWVLGLFGLDRVHLLDGGRELWIAQARPVDSRVPRRLGAAIELPPRDDSHRRIRREQLVEFVDRARGPLVDSRSPGEYSGAVLHPPGFPGEASRRSGHVPGAVNVPWRRALQADGTFRPIEQLRATYEAAGVSGDEPIVTYGRTRERSAHTWFVLAVLLGIERVSNYDGAWTEWGNLVGAPVERSVA